MYHFFQIKDDSGLKDYLSKNLEKLNYLDLSVSSITGTLFEAIDLPSLKQLYLDFCNKLCCQNLRYLDKFAKLKLLSLFGSHVELEKGAEKYINIKWKFEDLFSHQFFENIFPLLMETLFCLFTKFSPL